jgi:simple sugar transport system permease protein
MADLSLSRLSTDVLERFFRNLFLVLSLVIPIVAGLGLNFGIVLGAMAGQMGLMVVQNGKLPGLGGLTVAVICSIPIAMLLGWLTGLLFNRTRGREMITGIILGFFANGIYQLLFLILAGPVIPLHAKDVLLPQGMGLRVTINLTSVERSLDDVLIISLKTTEEVSPDTPGAREQPDGSYVRTTRWGEIPVLTLLVNVALCVLIWLLFRTKLGQDLRAVGQDPGVAEVAGIKVNRCRIIAIILSMILAGIGQIIFLQNMTVMNTFQSHEQVGFYAIAALLVGGATVTRVTIWNAVVGTLLFHTLIAVIAVAAQDPKLLNSPQIGEYLREFFLYAIICTTLAIHAWRHRSRARSH